jgi:FlaA1/EpsC-like NDP-sugar epimerase
MGEPVKIRDLAEQMIRFYGLVPEEDIAIEYVGLRPGEKLNEKLVWDSEIPRATEFDRIINIERNEPGTIDIKAIMEKLKPVCRLDSGQAEKYRNNTLLRNILRNYIPSYTEAISGGLKG